MLSLQQKLQLFDLVGYHPHEGGQMAAHGSIARLLAIYGGERAGKSYVLGAEALATLFPDPMALASMPRVAIAGQTYDETRQETEYVARWLKELGWLKGEPSMPRAGKWVVETLGGGYLDTVSLKDGAAELTARGKPYDLVILAEAGRIEYSALMRALGRVAQTRGRVIAGGTLWDDFGWYAELQEELSGPNRWGGQAVSIPSWENVDVYPEGRNDPEVKRLEAIMPQEEFSRLVEGKKVPSPARIYPEWSFPVHVREVEFDPELPVEVSIDPGYFPSRYVCLPIQRGVDEDGMELVKILPASLWAHHLTHKEAVDWCQKQAWWARVSKIYGGHETKQHASQQSTEDVWRALSGKPFEVVRKATSKWQDILRVKTFLEDPATEKSRLVVDPSCQGLAHEFPRYRRKTDSQNVVVSDEPAGKSEDDALDALANYLVGRFGLVDRPHPQRRRGHRRIPARG